MASSNIRLIFVLSALFYSACGGSQKTLDDAIADGHEKDMVAYCRNPRTPEVNEKACRGVDDLHLATVDEGIVAGDFATLTEFCRDTYSATTLNEGTRKKACGALLEKVGSRFSTMQCDALTPELGIDLRRLIRSSGFPEETNSISRINQGLAMRAGECKKYDLIFDYYPNVGFPTVDIFVSSLSLEQLDTILLEELRQSRSQKVVERFLWRLEQGPISCERYRPLKEREPKTILLFAKACPDESRAIALDILRSSQDIELRTGACRLMANSGRPWDARFVRRVARKEGNDKVSLACERSAEVLYFRQKPNSTGMAKR